MSQARRHTNEHIKDFIDIGVHIEQSTRHDHTLHKVSCQVDPEAVGYESIRLVRLNSMLCSRLHREGLKLKELNHRRTFMSGGAWWGMVG